MPPFTTDVVQAHALHEAPVVQQFLSHFGCVLEDIVLSASRLMLWADGKTRLGMAWNRKKPKDQLLERLMD